MPAKAKGAFSIRVKPSDEDKRLDVLVASLLSDCTRTFVAGLIVAEYIQVDGRPKKPGYRVKSGQKISGVIPPPVPPVPVKFKAEPIPIDILYEDDHIIVVNKQPGLVVHPAPGHYSGTLVNGLLYHCPNLGGIGGELRPGIVHRLDKDTSGTMIVAKNDAAHHNLSRQFKSRQIKKEYLALVHGILKTETGSIKLPIGRHPLDLKTGRTHQIRVHCAALHHPIVGDKVYRPRKLEKTIAKDPKRSDKLLQVLKSVNRQMLHAWRLSFTHPHSAKTVSFESPLPQDMDRLIDSIRKLKL